MATENNKGGNPPPPTQDLPPPLPTSVRSRLGQIQKPHLPSDTESTELKSTTGLPTNLIDVTQGNLQKQVRALEEREEQMQADIRKLTMAVERLAVKCESLEEDMGQLKKRRGSKEPVFPYPSPRPSPCPSPPPTRNDFSPLPLPPHAQHGLHPSPQKPLPYSPKPSPPPPLSLPPQKFPKPSRGRYRTTTDVQNVPIIVPLVPTVPSLAPAVPIVPSLTPASPISTAPLPVVVPMAPTLEKLTETVDPQQQKENMEDLRAMGVHEILYLLDIMGLTQYKEGFAEESIDGEILAECDEQLLEQELQIHNRLHRSRLMKVITGRHSASSLKYGLDPYGSMISRV